MKAAAAATGGGMAVLCAASMAGWWFDCSWCIANEVDDHRGCSWLICVLLLTVALFCANKQFYFLCILKNFMFLIL